jgi:hypothetical protein
MVSGNPESKCEQRASQWQLSRQGSANGERRGPLCWKKTISRGTKAAIVGRAQQKQWRVARVVEQGRQSSGKQPEPQFALGPWIQAAKTAEVV